MSVVLWFFYHLTTLIGCSPVVSSDRIIENRELECSWNRR